MNKRIRINGVLYEAVSPRRDHYRSMNESTTRKLTADDMENLGFDGAVMLYRIKDRDRKNEYLRRLASFTNDEPGLFYKNGNIEMVAAGGADWFADGDPDAGDVVTIIPDTSENVGDYELTYLPNSVSEAKRVFKKAAHMLDNGISPYDVASALGFERF